MNPRTRILEIVAPQEEGRPDAEAVLAERVQDTGEGVDDLMAQLQALGQG